MICFGSKYIQLITPGDYKTSKFILFNLIYRNQYPWRACCRSLKIISPVLKSTTCQTSHDCLTNKTRDDGRDLLESPQKFHSVPVSSVAFCFFASHAIDRKLDFLELGQDSLRGGTATVLRDYDIVRHIYSRRIFCSYYDMERVSLYFLYRFSRGLNICIRISIVP